MLYSLVISVVNQRLFGVASGDRCPTWRTGLIISLHTRVVQSFVHSYRLVLLLSWLYSHQCDNEVWSRF